jgi:hypothetical protein
MVAFEGEVGHPPEVQCCCVPPGSTGLIVTGLEGEALLSECLRLVRYVDAHVPTLYEYYKGRKPRSRRLKPDLHLHLHGPADPVAHRGYLGTAFVALVALVLKRRPRWDTVVQAEVDDRGLLRPVRGTAAISPDRVRWCRR